MKAEETEETWGSPPTIGLIAYYLGYMTGAEREHDRLCEQWMRERREDGE